jgi:hypothetical protein
MATEGQGSSRGQGELFQSFNVNVSTLETFAKITIDIRT